MRILITLTYYRPHYSGLTIYAEREARALAARGHQVTVLTSRFDPNLPSQDEHDGVRVIRPNVWFQVSKGVIMPSMPLWAWKLARQADVVHLHVPQFDAAAIAIIARLLRKPVVLTYHCDLRLPKGLIHSVANRVSDLANHVTARISRTVVHNTQDYAEHSEFLHHYLEKLSPVFPPIEMSAITESDRQAFRQKSGIQPGDRVIGMAARLATEKGAEYLAQALPAVLQKHPRARLLFVGPFENVIGEESYTRRMAPLIQELGDHWNFLGILSPTEMTAFFNECEVTVLPSINSTESYGMVQVESMSCGTPVVASDLPGVRVPVQETGAGIIVPARDSKSLGDALIKALDNPQAYYGHPEKLVKRSTPDHVAQEYEAIFNEVIEPSKERSIVKLAPVASRQDIDAEHS